MTASSAAGQNLVVRNYTELDGLPSSKVLDIRQAPSGLPWFATRVGLYEYDGRSWRRVLVDEIPAGSEVRFVRFDAQGRAWALLEGGSVVREGQGSVTSAPAAAAAEWLFDFELLERDGATLVALSKSGQGLSLWDGTAWSASAAAGAPPYALEPCFDELYLGGGDGLFTLAAGGEPRALQATPPLPPGRVRGLARERTAAGERLWVLGEGWLGTLADGGDAAGAFTLVAEGIPALTERGPVTLALVPDGRGGVLYGSMLALYHVDGRTGAARVVDRSSGLVGGGVNTLSRDAAGLLWGATDVGAFKLLGFDVQTLTAEHGLLDDEVTAVAELPDGRIALGHYGGLTLLGDGPPTRLRFQGLDPNLRAFGRVMDLCVDRAGVLWIGGGGKGLGRLQASGESTWIEVPAEGSAWANAVHEDARGELLVGTPRGLWRRAGDALELVDEAVLGRPFVRRLEVGRDGAVYLATPTGVWIGRDGRWRNVRSSNDDVGFDHFFTIQEDRAGGIWCGGIDGLWRLEGQELVRAGSAYDLRRPVYALTEDRLGRLWIGTDFGLSRSDGERLTRLDWLVQHTGTEANRAAALTDRRGSVWMGTTHGVTVIDAAFDVPTQAPPLELLAVEVAGKPQTPGQIVELDSGRTDLVFRARALSFLAEDKVEFRSRVAGFSDWTTVTGPNILEARYTGLPPGRFRFEVQARGPNGDFGAPVRSPWIRVHGPLWTRWWFLGLLLLLTSGLSIALQRSLTRRRQTRELQAEMAVRTRELEASLQELAKTDRLRSLGTLAGGIAHDLRNVLMVLDGNLSLLRERVIGLPEAQDCFDATDHAIERATELASQLQTFATGGLPLLRAVSLADLVQECIELVLSGARVTVDLEVEPELWPAEADQAQMRQVFENLLLNARQCQPDGGWIRVRGTNHRLVADAPGAGGLAPGRYVCFTVADGGPGISEENLRHIFDPFFTTKAQGTGLGLATALSVVRRHGGSLDVEATSSAGTVFSVLLPASEAPVAEPEPRPALEPQAGAGRVLVVDDEMHIRILLVRMLARLGFEAYAAASCDEALRVLAQGALEGHPFRFAIVDQTLPGDRSGPQVLERLREREPALRAAASSGYSEDAALAHHDALGFQVALPKPYRMDELAQAMRVLAGESPAALPARGGETRAFEEDAGGELARAPGAPDLAPSSSSGPRPS